MKKLLWIVALVCLPASTAQAQTLGWSEIPGTKIGGENTSCSGNCGAAINYPQSRMVVQAWGGGVMDTTRNRMIVWGGGHNDYSGNEIYAVNLSGTPGAVRLTNNTNPSGCGQGSCDGGVTPNSRHTYHNLAYSPDHDIMFVYSGGLAGPGNWVQDPWAFRFAPNTWENLGPISSGPLPTCSAAQCAVTYDPVTQKFWIFDGKSTYTYDYPTKTFAGLWVSGNGPVGYPQGVIDPVRRKFFINDRAIGGQSMFVIDMTGGGSNPYQPQSITMTGSFSGFSGGDAMAYDPVTGDIVGWHKTGGDTVYRLNTSTYAVTAVTGFTGGPGAAQDNGTYGRWNYSPTLNVFVLVNSFDQNVFTFRLNGGTPPPADTQAPTITLTAPSNGAVLSGSVNLTATASDNVAVTGVQFLVDGANAGSEDTVSPYLLAWDSNSVPNGSHTVAARARDAAGNTATTPAVAITTSNTAPPPPPPTSGLIVAYAFDEGSGSAIADASGNNNAATVQGTPVWVAGKYGNALSFNGSSSVLQNATSSYASSPLTFSLWAKMSVLAAGWQDLVKNDHGYNLSTNGNNVESHWSGGSYHLTSQTLVTDTWYHLASVIHSSGVQIYIDGVKVLDQSDSNGLSTLSQMIVGSGVAGIIDNVRVYNRALTPAEILSDMNTPIGGTPPPPPPSGPLTVGPGKQFVTVCAAVAAAVAGNTIEIDAALYPNEACTISQNNVTVRGVGGRAHLRWGTGDHQTHSSLIPNGKAILIVSGDNVILESLELSGAKVADQNGAGIRYEGGNLTLRDVYAHDNENGILGQGGLAHTLLIEYSIFERNGYCPSGFCAHNIYIGAMGRLVFQHNTSRDSREGHTLKSRAHVNEIKYNFLSTKNSDGSYEIDLPNGGTAYVIGNVIEQGANTGNSTLLGWGGEGATNPNPELRVVGNTFYNWRPNGATFVQVSGSLALSIKNNIFSGGGTQLVGGTADLTSNKTSSAFVNAAGGDFHLTSGSDAINAGVPPGTAGSYDLTPLWEYVEPAGRVARILTGTIDVGAYESNFAPPPPPPPSSCVTNPFTASVSQWPTAPTQQRQLRYTTGNHELKKLEFIWPGTVIFTRNPDDCTATVNKP